MGRENSLDMPEVGHVRVLINRRVTEEESITIDCVAGDQATAKAQAEEWLATLRDHMRAYNAEVRIVHDEQIKELERKKEAAAVQLRIITNQVEDLEEEAAKLNVKLEPRRKKLRPVETVASDHEG